MDTRSFHLRQGPAPEGLLEGVRQKGEFHEIAESASEVLLAGVAPTGEIHLEQQCASEGILEGVCLSLKEVDSQTARSNVYLSNRTEESVL